MDAVSSTLKVIVKEKKAETAFLISVFTVVFGCFCIPIIIYAVDSNTSAGQALEIDLDVDNCPQQVRNNPSACGRYICSTRSNSWLFQLLWSWVGYYAN